MHRKPSFWIVGDTRREEFRAALGDWLGADEEHAAPSFSALQCTITALTVDEAQQSLLAGTCAPEVMVLVEARPGEIAQAAVDRLRTLAPLARLVALVGSWCEGEMRTGRPWPGVVRFYWHQWQPRARQALKQMSAGRLSSWELPATATEEERLLCMADAPWPTRAGLVAIHTPAFEMADFLSCACRKCGYSTAWVRPGHAVHLQGAVAGIFDVRELDVQEQSRLRAFADSLPRARVVVLMDFPRIHNVLAAESCGASSVLSKPLLLDDLWEVMEERY